MDLQTWLNQEGLTHKQMADRCGVHQSTITRVCDGAAFSTELARRIYNETSGQVTPNDMLGLQAAGDLKAS